MSRKIVSVVFAAAAFVAAFASSAMVSSASAQGRGYHPLPAGPVLPVPHVVPVPVGPGVVAPAFHGGPH
ncbi:MAG: hypothetical protein ACRDBH_12580, partial [Bosea sp. (in: a-proteobacteria)]